MAALPLCQYLGIRAIIALKDRGSRSSRKWVQRKHAISNQRVKIDHSDSTLSQHTQHDCSARQRRAAAPLVIAGLVT